MDSLHDTLKRYWGYDGFRSLQEEIIRSVLDGKDTLALMPTGGGKSITYQVAGLTMEGLCLVVTPLIALMKDQVEDLKQRQIAAEAVYTGMEAEEVESVINKCIFAAVKFLYISPERLASERFREKLRQMKVCLMAVDEAHCISQWGYDFRPSYLRIAEVREFFPGAPVLALTATATPDVVADIQKQLHFAVPNVLSKSFRRENIAYVVRNVNDKLGELLHIIKKMQSSAIVYVRKRDTAVLLARFLVENGVKADYYHAGLRAQLRAEKQENWKKDVTPVIVATNAFGMGIDKSDVRIVVHFDIPDFPEAYFQEAGRAGRDGKKAYAVLLCNPASVVALKGRIAKNFPERTYVRKVYEALGNYFQVAEGGGAGYAFEFDEETFVKNFGLDYIRTSSAIQILQRGGYIECTTDVNSRSRVVFTVLRDSIDRIQLDGALQGKIVEWLMRKCPGVFTKYVFISEERIAQDIGVTRNEVYEVLLSLAKRKVLAYVPGNDRPYIVFTQPRLPASYLTIGKEAYEDRKKSFAAKVNEMVRYVEDGTRCRQLALMAYFGQKEKQPCGICDVCVDRKKRRVFGGTGKAEKAVLAYVQAEDRDLKWMVREMEEEYGRKTAVQAIRNLLDEGEIVYRTPLVLGIRDL